MFGCRSARTLEFGELCLKGKGRLRGTFKEPQKITESRLRAWLVSPGGGTPRKIGWGCAARFPKPLPYL